MPLAATHSTVPPARARFAALAVGAAALLLAGGVIGQPAPDECGRVDNPGTDQANTHVRAIERGLLPAGASDRTVARTLIDRMRYYGVPGVSVAVIHRGRIDWARGWGVRNASSCEPVTPETEFQAASISESVAAVTALRLVERGKLALDTDIDAYLKTWKLPRNEALTPPFVTLRQLLSHTAGTTAHGFPGYRRGEELPTLTQILDGAASANTPPIRMELAPGGGLRHSGGGYLVAQLAMTDVAQQSYEQLVVHEVFEPLGMQHSSIAPGPSSADSARAHADGRVIEGGYHRYPELAAAAVWTTPSDLARLLIDVQAAARGAGGHLLAPERAREMLSEQAAGWGLGFALAGAGHARRFGRDGRNAGFESTMTAYVERGEGVVVLTNADRGKQLADEIVRAVAKSYGWPGRASD